MAGYLTTARLRERAARLSPRDGAVLEQVAGLRFVSGAQLTRLCFADAETAAANARAARRALLRLTRLAALNRLPRAVGGVRSGSDGFVYYLGPVGQYVAAARGWQPERRRRRSLSPGTLFVRHALAVAELHARLSEGDRSRRFELLELTAEPACWRSYAGVGSQRVVLKPDSYVRLGVGQYEDSYFCEVDLGTEGTAAVGRQLAHYVSYYRQGREQEVRGVFPRVLWLAMTAERVGVLTDCVSRLPAARRGLFQIAAFDEAMAVFGSGDRP